MSNRNDLESLSMRKNAGFNCESAFHFIELVCYEMPTLRVPKKSKTVPKSFRIDELALLAVEAEANSQNVSPNTLVNQILKRYAEFDRFAHKVNSVNLSGSIFLVHYFTAMFEQVGIAPIIEMSDKSVSYRITD